MDLAEYGGDKAASDVAVPHGLTALLLTAELVIDLEEPGKIPVSRVAVLKHIMRSMHRMMQSSGTSEGLRGLLDSSLLKSIKKIMENGDVFGPGILSIGKNFKAMQGKTPLTLHLAINIMATFIHNEPTCLGVIQETGLPDTFYKVVESGLEPAIEVGIVLQTIYGD